tara:strand:+ start:1794 stop:1982 length:189 start_codon:yes stop_codon:yes gene_type:complete
MWSLFNMWQMWVYWCKGMGSHAYDNDKKDDYIHLILRTVWVVTHLVACFFIIAHNGTKLGWF